MAENANSARTCAWNTAYNQYLNLAHQLAQAQPHERDALERAVADQQEDLLDTEAASLRALFVKLEILFEGQIDGLDPESEAKRLILEDLDTLITQATDVIGLKADAGSST
jgi:hypothetical protein